MPIWGNTKTKPVIQESEKGALSLAANKKTQPAQVIEIPPKKVEPSAGSTETKPADRKLRIAVPRGVRFNGQLSFDTSAKLEGEFSGTMHCGGTLVVGEEARVTDCVLFADVVVLRGEMQGKIRAVKRVEIARGGCFSGELDTPSLSMEEGAVLNTNSAAIGL